MTLHETSRDLNKKSALELHTIRPHHKIGVVKTLQGGKNYHDKLRDYLTVTFTSLNVTVNHTNHSHHASTNNSGDLYITPQVNKAFSKTKSISFVEFQESELDVNGEFFQRLVYGETETGEGIKTFSLKETFQLLSERDEQTQLLFLVCEADDTETVTLCGTEDVVQVVGTYFRETQNNNEVFTTKVAEHNTESGHPSIAPDQSRQILAKAVVESILEKTGRRDITTTSVLEECVYSNLKHCEEWSVSLLTDLQTVSATEQYIRDINDHVTDYLTQSFRQKHGMLAIQDTTDCPRSPVGTTDHVAVLQKLSPTLSRDFKLEGTNLLDYMYEQDALSDTERQSILAQPTDKRKNEAFIDRLCANYSLVQFKTVILPLLQKDEDHRRIASVIEKQLEKVDFTSIESKCTFCKVKGLIDLRALAEPLLSLNAITPALRRDLCSPTILSRSKWDELVVNIGEEEFLNALKIKYPHFHEEFKTTGHPPMKCCCADDDVTVRSVNDVANMDDLLSETGSRVSYGLRDSVVDLIGLPSPNTLVMMDNVPGYRNICGICQQMIRDTRRLTCDHVFCKVCIGSVYRLAKLCPVCGTRFTCIKGTMPPGTMTHRTETGSLPGFVGFDTIVISYHIEDGIQKEEHPCQGQPYKGITCTAYLPNSLDGQLVLMLLQTAWDRSLTFTIRQSVSSTMDYVLSWNGISHKTNRAGGPRNHGYPDSEYLSRVRKELIDQGIMTEDLRSTMV